MPAARRTDPARRGGISEERLWQVGFLVGSVLGAAVTVAGRRIERSARAAGLVDWRRVEDLAIARLRSAPGALTANQLRATEGDYAAAMARVVPALSEHLGTELPGVVERVAVVDRATWVRANTAAFAGLIGRLEGQLAALRQRLQALGAERATISSPHPSQYQTGIRCPHQIWRDTHQSRMFRIHSK